MRWGKWHVLLVVGVGIGSVLGPPHYGFEPAFSLDQDVQKHYDLARSGICGTRRLAALEKLRTMESADAGKALAALAASNDDALAGHSGAEDAVEDVLEDTGRSDAARAAALTVWCERRSKAGDDWGDVEDYVEEKSGENAALLAAASAVKTARFAKGGK
jgi:hypothetical protein